jgi:Domain of unknown function (DUF4337)
MLKPTGSDETMAEAHEQLEHAEHAEHASHSNRGIALLISVLVLFLAIAETMGKSAQTNAITWNVKASDLWAFYQAKTIRKYTIETAAAAMTIEVNRTTDSSVKDAQQKQLESWKKESARLDDEPGKDGRKQLMEQARHAEEEREQQLAKYHSFEFSSAAFQIGIVLASASIITGIAALVWISGAMGVVGLILMGIGLFAPEAVHLFEAAAH